PTPRVSALTLSCSRAIHGLEFRSRPPPSSPPFPYTTLFRSRFREACTTGCPGRRLPPSPAVILGLDPRIGPSACALSEMSHAPPDRKSTRLHSSHVKTSYAVF